MLRGKDCVLQSVPTNVEIHRLRMLWNFVGIGLHCFINIDPLVGFIGWKLRANILYTLTRAIL